MKTTQMLKNLLKTSFMKNLNTLLGSLKIEAIAKEVGFIKRSTSRLNGKMFLEMNLNNFNQLGKGSMSLTDKSDYLEEHYNISMRKQSLTKRYNDQAVKFMRSCAEQLMASYLNSTDGIIGLTCPFSAIKIVDATSFKLPAAFSPYYAGTGGDCGRSSIKIHQSYELLKSRLLDFHITDGKQSDVTYWETGNWDIAVNELFLADLGYFKLANLKKIADNGAYFISRYKSGVNLYCKDSDGNLQNLNLVELLRDAKGDIDMPNVYIGSAENLPIRLIIKAVPEDVKQKRLKKIRAQAANTSKKRKQWDISEERKLLCGFTLFITNVPCSVLSSEKVQQYYSLRWQIELLFKIWKSILEIDKIGQLSLFRFEVYLYSRLILLLLCSQILAFVRDLAANDPDIDEEISEWKVFSYLKKN